MNEIKPLDVYRTLVDGLGPELAADALNRDNPRPVRLQPVSVTDLTVHCTLHLDGDKVGRLFFPLDTYLWFYSLLDAGCKALGGLVANESPDTLIKTLRETLDPK